LCPDDEVVVEQVPQGFRVRVGHLEVVVDVLPAERQGDPAVR
jgi:hypothetical protein